MALEKRTVLDRIEIECSTGRVFFKALKQVVDEGSVLFSEPHRSVVEVGEPVSAQLDAVNDHLQEMGFPAIDDSGAEMLTSQVAKFRDAKTDAVVIGAIVKS